MSRRPTEYNASAKTTKNLVRKFCNIIAIVFCIVGLAGVESVFVIHIIY